MDQYYIFIVLLGIAIFFDWVLIRLFNGNSGNNRKIRHLADIDRFADVLGYIKTSKILCYVSFQITLLFLFFDIQNSNMMTIYFFCWAQTVIFVYNKFTIRILIILA